MDESLRRSGPLASPAGVGTGLMSTGQLNTSIKWSHQTLAGFPSKPESRPAQRTPSGYVRKEPLVHAIHEQVGAGMSSVIDNTLRIKPLPPKWGKAREIVPAENTPPLRILAPATLAMSKGLDPKDLSAMESPEQMTSVLAPYSPSNSIFNEKYAPGYGYAGFVTSPSAYGGRISVDAATTTFKQSFKFAADSPNASPTSTMLKFDFDKTAGLPHIPVGARKMLFAKEFGM